MHGGLLQSIVLTSYGNAYLYADRPVNVLSLLESHIAFSSDESLQFGRALAGDPTDAVGRWFKGLRKRKVERLWLTSYMGVVTQREAGLTVWRCTSQMPKGGSKWRGQYQFKPTKSLPKSRSVRTAGRHLAEAVANISQFAESVGSSHWSQWFREAHDQITLDHLSHYLPPHGYSKPAATLIMRASALDVSGRHPWSDSPPKMSRKAGNDYLRLSNQLAAATDNSILAAVNSFAEPIKGSRHL